MSYLRLHQDREHFDGESETYAYQSEKVMCLHDESNTPPDEDNQPWFVPIEDFYELMISILGTTDLDPETVEQVGDALVRKRERDAARMEAFKQRSARTADRFQRLQAEVEDCSECADPSDRCEHHKRMVKVIADDGNPWTDQELDQRRARCSIEGCDNSGRHELVPISSDPSEARSECDEHFYATPENGWPDYVEFIDERVTYENELDKRCPECRVMNLCTTMVRTSGGETGPASVCFECGFVDKR
jgi:hypothetical protein